MPVIPSSRLVTWQGNCGVSGGIPTTYTKYGATLSPLGGTSDDTPQIIAALSAASANQYVLLGAGTFLIKTGFDTQNITGANSKILRGSGTTSTFLNTSTGIIFDIRGDFYDPSGVGGTRSALSSSASKGDTTITLADASWVTVGDSIVISLLDDTTFVNKKDENDADAFSYLYPGTRGFSQTVKVAGKASNTLTLEVPLGWDFTTTLTAQAAKVANSWISFFGVEDLTVAPQYTDSGSNTFHIQEAQNCWLKNIRINNVNRTGVFVDFGYRIEIRHCYFNGSNVHGPGQGYGVAFNNATACSLGYDNILIGMHLGFSSDYGSFGNAFVNNYAGAGVADSSQAPAGGTHGYHAWMTLWEGNYFVDKVTADNTHGSGSHALLFRNRIIGYNATYSYDTTAVHGAAWNRRSNIVGNILGKVGTHTIDYSYYPTSFDPSTQKACFRWGDDNDGVRLVGDNQATADLIVTGNWDAVNQVVSWDGSGVQALPDSYIFPSKPAEFGILSWPPYTSSVGDAAAATDIPAGYRFVNGNDPPASSGGSARGGICRVGGAAKL